MSSPVRYIVRTKKEVKYLSGAQYVLVNHPNVGFIGDFDCDPYHFITKETAQCALLACENLHVEYEVVQVTYVVKRTVYRGIPPYLEDFAEHWFLFNNQRKAKRFTREDARALVKGRKWLKVVRLNKRVSK